MPRFFVPPDALHCASLQLDPENAAHAKVMRLRTGDHVVLCDGQGSESDAVIADSTGGQYLLELSSIRPSRSEPSCRISVYMAYAKSDKLEHVAQKATELGASEFVVFPSARCVSRPDEKSLKKRADRWNKILRSAAEQSGRGKIPELVLLQSYAEALARASQAERFLFFYENEQTRTLKAALTGDTPQTVSLMTGPEGGFEPEEVAAAEASGALICSLGPRILRCETAPLCALTAVLFACGEYD